MIPPPILAVNHPFCILNSCACTVQQLAQKGWEVRLGGLGEGGSKGIFN